MLLWTGGAALYFVIASWLHVSYEPPTKGPGPAGEKHQLVEPFRPIDKTGIGFAFYAIDPWFFGPAERNNQSLLLYEDGKLLGPVTLPVDVNRYGLGRYAHWWSDGTSGIAFSSSDNTDPRTNGREYWVVKPR